MRGPLLCVLLVQVGLTLRLGNTAFQDEALYLYAGHREIALLLHGTPTFDNYASYFSGAPFLYPVFGAVLDSIGGLALARTASMILLLATTLLLYATARRLVGRQGALFAALVFAVAEPTLFMGHLATFDAPALLLLAIGFWLVVRTAHRAPLAVVWGAPVLVLAGAMKYVALLYWPTVVGLAVLITVPHRGWAAAARRGVWLAAATAACALGLLRLAPELRAGVSTTTSHRTPGTDPVSAVLRMSATYIGIAVLLAVVGSVLYTRHAAAAHAARPDHPSGARAPSVPPGPDGTSSCTGPGPATWRVDDAVGEPQTERQRGHAPQETQTLVRGLTGALLTATALLAPANQSHLHTITSLQKHVGFGLLFAAPMAGVALARILSAGTRRDLARTGLVTIVCLGLAWSGVSTSQLRYADWPDASALVAVMKAKVRPVDGRYLVEESEVPRYYLRGLTQPYQWTGTYYFTYKPRTGPTLAGVPAYRAAIAARYFDVVALRYGPTAGLDTQIDAGLRHGGGYTLIAKLPYHSSYGAGYWFVWSRS